MGGWESSGCVYCIIGNGIKVYLNRYLRFDVHFLPFRYYDPNCWLIKHLYLKAYTKAILNITEKDGIVYCKFKGYTAWGYTEFQVARERLVGFNLTYEDKLKKSQFYLDVVYVPEKGRYIFKQMPQSTIQLLLSGGIVASDSGYSVIVIDYGDKCDGVRAYFDGVLKASIKGDFTPSE